MRQITTSVVCPVEPQDVFETLDKAKEEVKRRNKKSYKMLMNRFFELETTVQKHITTPIIEAHSKMRPLSIWQWLCGSFGGTSCQVPMYCSLCGKPSKGNVITGFYVSCETIHSNYLFQPTRKNI